MDVRRCLRIVSLLAAMTAFVLCDVENVTMSVDSEYLMYPPHAYVNVVFRVTSGVLDDGTKCKMDLRDGQGIREFDLQLDHPYQLVFTDTDVYDVSAVVSDAYGSKTLSAPVTVLEKMVGPLLVTEFAKAPYNQSMEVRFYLYSAPSGQLCTLTFDFGNGTVVSRPRAGQGKNGSDVVFVTYTSKRVYTINVTATTPVQTLTVTRDIEVIRPVLEADVTASVNPLSDGVNEKIRVQLVWESQSSPVVFPEDVSILVDTGEELVADPKSKEVNITKLRYSFTEDIRYSSEGQYTVKVVMFNKASWVERNFTVNIFEDFKKESVEKCFRPEVPRSITCEKGLEGQGNIFYAGTEIIFRFTTSNNATALFYEFTATYLQNASHVIRVNRTANPFTVDKLKELGDWDIKIRAVNPIYNKIVTTSVSLVQKVVNFQLTHDRHQKSAGVPKVFWVSFHVQGLETCLTLDFGDDTFQVYADSSSHCTLTGNFTGLPLNGSLTGLTEVQHTYTQEGYYLVTAVAASRYNNETQQIHLDITSLNCLAPEVEIYNASHKFYEPHTFRRADIIKFRAIPRIDCYPFDNVKLWEIHEIDPNWGTVVAPVDLSGVKTDDAEIRLDRLTLELKLYRVTFTMTMIGHGNEFRFTGSDYSYFEVGRSKLVGIMGPNGETETIVSKYYPLSAFSLSPLSYSYDDDTGGSSSGLSIASWFCSYWSAPGTENATDPQVSDMADCPNNMMSSTYAKTGSSGYLNVPHSLFTAGKIYNFTAVLTKDTRHVAASILVRVVLENKMRTQSDCAAGTTCISQQNNKLILKSARLGIRAFCAACPDIELQRFNWEVFADDHRWISTGGWRPLLPQDLAAVGTIGYEEGAFELAISDSLFTAFDTAKRFRVVVSTHFNGIEYWTATHYVVNTPPTGGTCTVEPEEMVVTLEKLFRIRCQNWVDDAEIESYQFFSYADNASVPVQMTWVMTPRGEVDLNVSIGLGSRESDYYTTVQAVVRDTFGATTRLDFGRVRVTPAPVQETRTLIRDLPRNVTSPLAKTKAEGDLISFTEFATIVGSIVNGDKVESAYATDYFEETTAAEMTTAEATTASDLALYNMQKERDNRAILREKVVETMTALPLNDVLSMDQTASTLSEFLKYPDEVTNEAQVTVMDIVTKMTDMLNNSQRVISADRMKNLLYIISAKGSSLAAGGSSGFSGTLTALDRAEQDYRFNDYETFAQAKDDDCIDFVKAYFIEEATERQRRLTNCIVTREKSYPLAQKGDEVMNKVFDSFLDNSILGESRQFDTEHQHTRLKMTEASKILEEPVKMEGSDASAEFPDSLTDVFTDGSVRENDSVLIEITENSNIPLRYSPGGKNINDQTTFVTVDIKSNSTRQRLNVTNMARPVKVKIPRHKSLPVPEPVTVDPSNKPWTTYVLHRTVISKKGASLHVTVCPNVSDVQLVAVVSLGRPPDHTEGVCNASFLVPPQLNLTDSGANQTCTKITLDNEQLDDFQGPAFIGVRQLLDSETDLDVSDCRQLPDSWANDTDTPFSCNYNITVFTSGCYFWSEADNDWSSERLRVHPDTDESVTVCEATHLTTFAGGWVVAPNAIDWDFVFSNFDFGRNPTLYGTEIAIFVIYIIAFIWARRKDKKDLQKLGLAPLVDNDPEDKYFYEIIVVTGMRQNAGTKSKVYFVLVGEKGKSDIRQFSDSEREIFRWGTADGFLMATPRSLGDLQFLRIWHDNSGQGEWGSWFLGHVTVRDVITDQKWVFVANTWLAVEEGDGQITRVISSTTTDRLSGELGHTVSERCRRNLTDDHLWFSVVTRPAQSRFTRVQRVSCCLCLLLTSMLANAMFYRTDSDTGSGDLGQSDTNIVHLGPFAFSPGMLFIGVVSNLIVFPVNVIIITLFRKARPRQKKTYQVDSSRAANSQSDDDKPQEVIVSFPLRETNDATQAHTSDTDGDAQRPATQEGMSSSPDGQPRSSTDPNVKQSQSNVRAPPVLNSSTESGEPRTDNVNSVTSEDKAHAETFIVQSPSTSTDVSTHQTEQKEKDEQKKKKKKKKSRGLPWWCRIVAWVLLVLTCLVCAAFVTFYGIQFADATCQKWLSSMLVSFFMSVFITQPIKVFLLAIVLALIFRSPVEDEETESDEDTDEKELKLQSDEVLLHQTTAVDEVDPNQAENTKPKKRKKAVYSSDGDFICPSDGKPGKGGHNRQEEAKYLPLNAEQLAAARERRLKEIQMWRVIREVVVYVVFVVILLLIGHRDRTNNTFLYKDTMRRTFIVNDMANFEGVTSTEKFWSWARTGLLDGLRAGPYYNKLPPLLLRGYINDKESKILGYATLRQHRVKPNGCRVPSEMRGVIEACNTEYEYRDQETRTFDIGWKERTTASTENDTAEWYRYTDGKELNSYPYWGELALYAGGGYVARLKGSRSDILSLLTRLESEQWIDKYTRVVFVEFTVYNAQVNLFAIARIVAEFQRTGGVVSSYRFEPALLLPYATSGFYLQLACEVIFCLFILAFLIRLLVALAKERRAFFTSFWNLNEFCIVALSVAGIVLYFYRLFETNKLTKEFQKTNGVGFINFQYVGYWNEIFGYMLGWIVFFAILKFLRLLRFNRRMSMLASTLRASANGLLQLSLVFWVVFLSFAMLFHLTFMTIDDRYSSFIGSVVANVLMIMGKFSINTLTTEEPVLAPISVFLYATTITFILLNMFITVLSEGFTAVRTDVAKQQNDYEIVDFLLARFKHMLGWKGTDQENEVKGEEDQGQGEDDQDQEDVKIEEVKDQDQKDNKSAVEKLPEKVDAMLEIATRLFPGTESGRAPMATSINSFFRMRAQTAEPCLQGNEVKQGKPPLRVRSSTWSEALTSQSEAATPGMGPSSAENQLPGQKDASSSSMSVTPAPGKGEPGEETKTTPTGKKAAAVSPSDRGAEVPSKKRC